MKQLLFSILMLTALAGCAGLAPVNEADRTITHVIELPGLKRDQIYNGTKIWIAENFRSAKSVIEHDDPANGTIIGNGSMSYPCSGLDCMTKNDWTVRFTMRVDTKDEKARATFTNIGLRWPHSSTGPAYDGPVNLQGDMDAIKPQLIDLASSLGNHLKKPAASSDW